MSERNRSRAAIWALVVFVSIALNVYLIYRHNNAVRSNPEDSKLQTPNSKLTYVCPMHPQVTSDHPADCPICGMKLVKRQGGVSSDAGLDSLIGTVKLSPTQELLANVTVEYPTYYSFAGRITMPGTIRQTEEGLWKASARAMGRVEKLYVTTPGQAVERGRPLYDFFSPDIAAATRELVYLKSSVESDDALEAARGKLLSLGVEAEQLLLIEESGEAPDVLTFHAPRSGVLMEKMVSEGEWVMPGMALLDFADFSDVWVEGALFEKDAREELRVGAEVRVVGPSGKTGMARLTVVGPMADMMTRTIPIRALLANPGRIWLPGMFVTLSVGEGGAREALSLPEDAVLVSGRGAVVWVQVAEGRFAPRMVTIGMHQDGRVAILSGVLATDAVAVTGAYLIDSNAQILKVGMAGMKHERDEGTKKEMDEMRGMQPTGQGSDSSQTPNSKLSYTCPMHPEVVSAEPGRCPKCGMFLVKKEG